MELLQSSTKLHWYKGDVDFTGYKPRGIICICELIDQGNGGGVGWGGGGGGGGGGGDRPLLLAARS